jgi:hypothetical protein
MINFNNELIMFKIVIKIALNPVAHASVSNTKTLLKSSIAKIGASHKAFLILSKVD